MAWRWASDVDPASWIGARLHEFGVDVASVVPDGFDAYARVFHPLERAPHRRWSDLARSNGRIAHAEMQWHHIARPVGEGADDPYRVDALVGSLRAVELTALERLLRAHTRSESCWFAVWDGFGQLHGGGAVAVVSFDGSVVHPDGIVPPEVRAGPRVQLPHRSYYLARGSLSDALALTAHLGDQSPNLWWPDDRSWCVATEIDLAWTYVGGSRALIDAVVADSTLEALETLPTHRIGFRGDEPNAALDGP